LEKQFCILDFLFAVTEIYLFHFQAPVTTIYAEGSSSRKCASYSTYSENRPSSFVGVPASTSAKPSALRMPSPSVGFFSQVMFFHT
jgi:hypothetical protein